MLPSAKQAPSSTSLAPGPNFGVHFSRADGHVRATRDVIRRCRACPAGKPLREQLPPLLGCQAGCITQGEMSCDLGRVRLHGLVRRIPKSHRYRVTDFGLRAVKT